MRDGEPAGSQPVESRSAVAAAVRSAVAVVVAAALVAFLAACGGDDGEGGGSEGGAITIAQSDQPGSLDPAITYSANVWEAEWLVYTPLLTYRRAEGEQGAELIPGLAEEMPEISEDGTTFTLTLRDGLEYSDGTPVRAGDFEHAIKRVLNLESPGTQFFLGIVGASDYLEAGDPQADISGIEADDATGEITIRLDRADASFPYALAMNFAGLVPADTPFEDLTADPPPGVGPYEITRSVPNREFVLSRNEDFGEMGIDGVPEGHIDTITTEIIRSPARQAQDVLANELDYMQDAPPADLLPTVREQAADRYEEHPSPSTFYFFLNVQEEPFDDEAVREAVNIGVDRPALARLYGGQMQPGCSFLPPGMPGYDEELDSTECPWGDPGEAPDVERARQMISDAGAEGAEVTVWGNNAAPTAKVTEAYAEMLGEIGLDATPQTLNEGAWFGAISDPEAGAQTGFFNFFQDFTHPLNFYVPILHGDSIGEGLNFSRVDDERIDSTVDELRTVFDLEAAADDWAELDRYVVESAYLVPYGHRELTTFVSERIALSEARFHPNYGNDYSSWRLQDAG